VMPHLTKENVDRFFEFHDIEKAHQALAQGKGLLGLTLHLGAGDMALAALALKGIPVVIASKEFKLRWLNDIWFGMRARTGIKFVGARNSSFALLKSLKSGQAILIPNDQFTGPPIGVRTTFFGKETGTAAGMAVMAARSGAPVLSMYVYRKPSGVHSIHFEKFMSTEGTPETVTQAFNDELERFVRLHPDQWMWLHKRWKRFVVN
jgi:Kdo2-lipid IVA lauroyltransferase/acyltransferase